MICHNFGSGRTLILPGWRGKTVARGHLKRRLQLGLVQRELGVGLCHIGVLNIGDKPLIVRRQGL